jgi:hypothetical protein
MQFRSINSVSPTREMPAASRSRSPPIAMEVGWDDSPIPVPMCSLCKRHTAMHECRQCRVHLSLFCSEECFETAHERVTEAGHTIRALNPTYEVCTQSGFTCCTGEHRLIHPSAVPLAPPSAVPLAPSQWIHAHLRPLTQVVTKGIIVSIVM